MKILTTISAALLISCSQPIITHSQINEKDRYVTLAPNDQIQQSIARPSQNGYMVVVWKDNRPNAEGIYAQKIETSTGLAMWLPIDGVPVCTVAGDKNNPKAAYDTLGGVIVVWEDGRDAQAGGGIEIFAQRLILNTGEIDAGWFANYPDGTPVCASTGFNATRPRIAGTGEGAYITWIDDRNVIQPNDSNKDVYLQYILSSSGHYPSGQWVDNGLLVPQSDTYSDDQTNPELALDNYWRNGHQGAVVVYEDKRNFLMSGLHYWNIYGDAFDRDGNRTWRDDLRLDQSDWDQNNARIVSTSFSNDGYVVVWDDARPGVDTDIYAQLIDRTGSNQWRPALCVCYHSDNQRYPEITLIESQSQLPQVIVAWEDERAGNTDVYANLINVQNAGVMFVDGSCITNVAGNQHNISIDSYYDGGFHSIIGWESSVTGATTDIYCQDISVPTWSMNYQTNGQIVTNAKYDQTNVQVAKNVFVFADYRRHAINFDPQQDINIYAQKLGDACDNPTLMNWKDVFARWSLSSNVLNYKYVAQDSGGTDAYVVWEENRIINNQGDSVHGVFIQKIDKNGVPRWKNNGVLLSETNVVASTPDVCLDMITFYDVFYGGLLSTCTGAYVIWKQKDVGSSDNYIMMKRIASDGSTKWSFEPTEIGGSRISGNNYEPVIVEKDISRLGEGFGAWYAFLNDTPGNTGDRYFGWVKADGTLCTGMETNNFYDGAPMKPRAHLKITKDREGGAYLLSMSHTPTAYTGGFMIAEHIASDFLVWSFPSTEYLGCDKYPIHPAQPTDDTQFKGYDIVCEPIEDFSLPTYHYDAIIACSSHYDNGGTSIGALNDIWVMRFFNNPNAPGVPQQKFSLAGFVQLSDNNNNLNPDPGNAQYPAIDADNLDRTGSFCGGASVAWDNFVINAHQVLCNGIAYSFSGSPLYAYTPFFYNGYAALTPVLVRGGIYGLPNPDIAHLHHVEVNNGSTENKAAIVWQCGEPGSCEATTSSIECQLADFTQIPTNALMWTPYQVLSPSSASFSQTNAIAQSYNTESDVYVFWMDNRSGYDCVLGTRMYNGGAGIGLRKSSERNAMDENAIRKNLFTLYQNYPNPFSTAKDNQAVIRFSLSRDAFVSLRFYSPLGKEIAILHDGYLTEGMHAVQLDQKVSLRTLPSGMYYYTLTVGDESVTRIMSLLR